MGHGWARMWLTAAFHGHSKVMPGNLMPTVIAAPLRNASLASNVVGRQLARASAQSEIAQDRIRFRSKHLF
jgi:hypothetical protein